MKKFTKLFLSCAMVASIAAMAAVAASAEEVALKGDLAGTYDTETGKITVTAPADLDATQAVTFIAYEKKDATTVAADDVVAIEQTVGLPGAADKTGVKGKPQVEDEGKTYIVKIGYYNASGFTTKSGELKLSTAADVLYGDCSGMTTPYVPDTKQNSADALAILKYANKDAEAQEKMVGDIFIAADVATMTNMDKEEGDGKVNTGDATAILKFANKQKTGIGLLKQYVTE